MKVDGIFSGIQTNYDYDPISRVKAEPDKNAGEIKEDDAKKKVAEDAKKVTAEVYGDVLSKSADGDTTRAAKQSIDALSDGLVMPKNNTEEITTALKPNENSNPVSEAAEKDAKKAENEEEIDSLTGYTSNQLENLYAQGKISRYDYDREISRRDELTKTEDTQDSEEEKVTENDAEEGDKTSELIKQQIEGNNTFNKEMSGLVNTAINENQAIDALNIGKENDRLDIVNQILNGNS